MRRAVSTIGCSNNTRTAIRSWFENVVTALLRGLVIEYEQLNTGYRESIRSMAWACRNLMEISIYTEYALRSEENAHELIDDMLMDVLDIFTSFKKWFTALDPTLPTPELNAELKKRSKKPK